MRPKPIVVAFAALIPAVLYVLLFQPINRVAYPPPFYTLMVMLYASSIPGSVIEIAVGAMFHMGIFIALNSYLLSRRFTARRVALWAPSFVALSLTVAIQVSMVPEAWRQQDYPGSRSSVVLGFLVLLTSVVFAIYASVRLPHRAAQMALAVNCLLYCGLIAVLFPYVGELP